MFTASRRPLLPLVGAAAALAAWLLAVAPAGRVGFLADDFEVGAILAARAEREPSFVRRAASLFVEQIGERFQVYRPLTILTVELDYAAHGTDGGGHHATSIAAWFLAAVLAGLLAGEFARRITDGFRPPDDAPPRRFSPEAEAAGVRARAAGFLCGLGAFAAVEALGWLVAREDLFVAIAALGALRAQLRRPHATFAAAPWILFGLLSKDTAVVLAPCLLAARLAVRCDAAPYAAAPEPRAARGAGLGAALMPWLLVAAYLGLRRMVFGSLGMKYLDRSYGEWLADGAAPGHLAASLGRLVAPLNEAWAGRFGLPPAVRFVAPAAALVFLALAIRVGRRRGLLVAAAVAAPFLLAAPALTSPMYEVAPTLQQGRTLASPAFVLAALYGAAAAIATGAPASARSRRAAAGALVAFGAWSLFALWFHLGPFVAASAHVEGVLADFTAAPPAARLAQVGGQTHGRGAEDFRQELVTFDGAYAISGALSAALGRPFRDPPRVFDPTAVATMDPASGALLVRDPRRTAIFRAEPAADLPCGPGEPRFRPWWTPDDVPEAELARLGVADGSLEVFPRAPGGRLRLRFLSDLGRHVELDLGPPPPPDAAPQKSALPPEPLATVLAGGPRYVLWTAEVVDARGVATARQAPRAFFAR